MRERELFKARYEILYSIFGVGMGVAAARFIRMYNKTWSFTLEFWKDKLWAVGVVAAFLLIFLLLAVFSKKGSVITFSIIGIILYLVFTVVGGMFSIKFGDVYEYGNISLEHYAITKDNYDEYNINHTIKSINKQFDESGKIIENVVNNNYSFKLSTNNKNNLLLTNLNTDYYIEIECESLYDYIIFEDNDNYVLAYIDYMNSSNAFLNYIYIEKTELSNDNQYLNKIKNNIKKYLLPTRAELLVISDYDNNKSYLSAYDIDYGHYLLINENEMSVLNRN
jgi:hypothetical protein